MRNPSMKIYQGNPCKRGHDGRRYSCGHCVTCELRRSKRKREKNKDQYTQWMREWRSKNPTRNLEIDRRARKKRREKANKRHRDYKKKNAAKMSALEMKRHAAKMHRTPAWADLTAIEAIYKRCDEITRETGIQHEVDHIIPLQGEIVSGLHVHQNLQIIPASENRRKHNRFV